MASVAEIPSVKDLASSEPSIRRRALQTITSHLTNRTTPLPPLAALQLWKGFFYALYMHDSKSAVSVQNLVNLLADNTVLLSGGAAENTQSNSSPITNTTKSNNALILTEAFWTTISREWLNIDALRMDKYLSLVRAVLRRVFIVCATSSFSSTIIDEESTTIPSPPSPTPHLTILTTSPLSPRDRKVPDGLRYHVLDIYVDELEKVVSTHNSDQTTPAQTRTFINMMLAPVETLAKDALTKGVRVRAKDVLADQRVGAWRGEGEEQEGDG